MRFTATVRGVSSYAPGELRSNLSMTIFEEAKVHAES